MFFKVVLDNEPTWSNSPDGNGIPCLFLGKDIVDSRNDCDKMPSRLLLKKKRATERFQCELLG